MRETLRLWTEEAGRPKLTNLQACQPIAVAWVRYHSITQALS